MIKDINNIIKLGSNKAKAFMKNAHIYEKLDMFYFKVKIESVNSLRFYKANKEIRIEDLILNKMWIDPINDLPKILIPHPEILKEYVGCVLGFFYLPCEKPLKISYSKIFKKGIRYILSDIENHKGERKNINPVLIEVLLKNPSVDVLVSLDIPAKISEKEIENIIEENSNTNFLNIKSYLIANVFDNFVLKQLDFFADEKPEGFIFKLDGKNYQLVYETEKPELQHSTIGMEFLISNFCDWFSINKFHRYTDWISTYSYLDSVCELFKRYIKSEEFSNLYYGLTAAVLESPTFGYYAGTGTDYIPDKEVRTLCESSKLNENIFKILLNGLRKPKKSGSYEFLTKKSIKVWNDIVKMIGYSYSAPYKALQK